MKQLLVHNPFFRLLAPPAIGLFSYLLILLFYNDYNLFVTFFAGQELYVVIAITYILFELGRLSTILTHRFYSFSSYEYTSVAIQVIGALIISYLVVTIAISLYFTQLVGFSVSRMQLTLFNAIFLSFALLYQLFYYGLYFMSIRNESRMKEELERNEDIKDATVRFTNEINPNMLYDSLESLLILSRKNPDDADEFINNLSEIYRYILSNRQSELVSLDVELAMAQKMIELLNHKYQKSLIFRSNLQSDKLDIVLIPGTLPKLLERIVENSIVTPSFPLLIECEFDRESEYIEISYKLNEKLVPKESGILAEIQRSYQFLSDKPVVHVKAYGQGFIKIPSLKNQSVSQAL